MAKCIFPINVCYVTQDEEINWAPLDVFTNGFRNPVGPSAVGYMLLSLEMITAYCYTADGWDHIEIRVWHIWQVKHYNIQIQPSKYPGSPC